jgi:hypothetical protein
MRARIAIVFALVAVTAAWGAAPPALVNYQGILRNAGGAPLNGAFDMVFTFYDNTSGGSQILIDSHLQSGSGPVTVANGLLNVALGGGTVTDGSGSGTYTSADLMFRDYSVVWMEIQVGPTNGARDTLSPMIRIVSSAYALNTGKLGGQPSGSYIDTSASTQTKAGSLVVQGGLTGNSNAAFGVFGNGGTSGGAFQALSGISFAYAGYAGAGHYGIRAQGGDAGGFFRDADNLGTAYVAPTDQGMQASGAVGGVFSTIGRTGYAEFASGHTGVYARGNYGAGELDNFMTGTSGTLAVQFGIQAAGVYCSPFCGAGAHFSNSPSSGRGFAAFGDTGFWGAGASLGGEFVDPFSTGDAQAAAGNFGIIGKGKRPLEGNGGGGYFQDPTYGGLAIFGSGQYGVWASGANVGGSFGSYSSGLNVDAGAAYGDQGIRGKTLDSNNVRTPGYFVLTSPSIYAQIATYWSDGPYTIRGNGLKSFVQNDPHDASKQVVFAALEGDEASTYTRGAGRIAKGEARVKLDPAFASATNPDIGLTALVTPRGAAVPLAVASVSSDEIVVRAAGPEIDGVAFDYEVYGLRLGFEQILTVQPKDREANLPPETTGTPDAGSALARFASMRRGLGETSPPDLSRSRRMKQMVREATADVDVSGTRASGTAASGGPDSGARPAVDVMPTGSVDIPARGLSAPVPAATALATGAVAAFRAGSDASGRFLVPATAARGEIVAGIVGGHGRDDVQSGTAPLALGGSIALCQADASFGSIKVGDLLAPSSSPGRARLATGADGGAIVAKALEPLVEGAGPIRVLVMSR